MIFFKFGFGAPLTQTVNTLLWINGIIIILAIRLSEPVNCL